MVRREPYEGNEPTGPGGAFNLAKLLGNSQHMSNGFVSFTIKTFSVSACSAVRRGVACLPPRLLILPEVGSKSPCHIVVSSQYKGVYCTWFWA